MPDHRTASDDRALFEAAVEAELRTGRHEASVQEARSHLLVRCARIVAGLVVLLAGIALTILPGPGLVLILAGLSILAVDVPFARRLRDVVVERADKATSFIPRRLKIGLMVAGCVCGVGLSLLFVVR
jgi:uncharacterized protein (TIGR02611 family)